MDAENNPELKKVLAQIDDFSIVPVEESVRVAHEGPLPGEEDEVEIFSARCKKCW